MNLLLKQGDPIPQILSTNISAFEWNPICVFIMATSKLMTQNRSGHIYIHVYMWPFISRPQRSSLTPHFIQVGCTQENRMWAQTWAHISMKKNPSEESTWWVDEWIVKKHLVTACISTTFPRRIMFQQMQQLPFFFKGRFIFVN